MELTEEINDWVENGRREGFFGRPFGVIVIWITFLSFMGRLSL